MAQPLVLNEANGSKILILGGSSEAAALARALAGDPRFDGTLSLAGSHRASGEELR